MMRNCLLRNSRSVTLEDIGRLPIPGGGDMGKRSGAGDVLLPLLVGILLMLPRPAATDVGPLQNPHFPKPAALTPNVAFWKQVYTQHGIGDFVVHDRDNLGVIYDRTGSPGLAVNEFKAALELDPRLKGTKLNLAVAYGHNGGWGIFDSSQPWGPWSVVFHTEYWGLGETHGYRIPAKWITDDGHELTLVFSGLVYNGVSYDAFCTRKMRLAF